MKLGELEVPQQAEVLQEGVVFWRNPVNSFAVLAIHYTADPEKRTTSWKEEASRGLTNTQWAQEYDLSFSSFAGFPIYSSFNRLVHVAREPLTSYFPRKFMYRGWDIGTHAVIWFQVDEGRCYVYGSRQIVGAFDMRESKYRACELDCSGLGIFIHRIKELSTQLFPKAMGWRDVVDPAAFNQTIKREGDEPAKVFYQHGIYPLPGATQDPDLRVSIVEDWLSSSVKGEPAIIIDPTALVVIDGMAGGYKRDKYGKVPTGSAKGPHSHVQESLQYGLSRLPSPKSNPALMAAQEQVITKGLDPAKHDLQIFPHRDKKVFQGESWMSY